MERSVVTREVKKATGKEILEMADNILARSDEELFDMDYFVDVLEPRVASKSMRLLALLA
jgi:hypothetical protein